MIGRTTVGLWLASLGAAVVLFQLTPYGLPFYLIGERLKGGWYGIPHTADLMLLAAVLTIAFLLLTMLDRNPVRGRNIGLLIGFIGLLAVLQLGYRTMAPPFAARHVEFYGIFGTSCHYYCWPATATKGVSLPGIWLALGGCVAIMLGGFFHAISQKAGQPAADLLAEHQTGANFWLLLAAFCAIGSFIAGYSIFVFYTIQRVERGFVTFSGWTASPHTGGLVLGVALAVVGLVWMAARRRSWLNPVGVGATIAILAAISSSRIYYRIIEPPFAAARGPREVEMAAYVSLGFAVLVVVAGSIYATTNVRNLK